MKLVLTALMAAVLWFEAYRVSQSLVDRFDIYLMTVALLGALSITVLVGREWNQHCRERNAVIRRLAKILEDEREGRDYIRKVYREF